MTRFSDKFIDELIAEWGAYLPEKEELRAGLLAAEDWYDGEMDALQEERNETEHYREERKEFAKLQKSIRELMKEMEAVDQDRLKLVDGMAIAEQLLFAIKTIQQVMRPIATGGTLRKNNREPVVLFMRELRKVWRGNFQTYISNRDSQDRTKGKYELSNDAGRFALKCARLLELPAVGTKDDQDLIEVVDNAIRASAPS
jgi:predicted nuclease with TOPRIM domain